MKVMLDQFAEQFTIQQERRTQEEDEQRSIRNPVVFLFLGDYVKEALDQIYKINKKKWDNSAGVMYVHAYQHTTSEKSNIVCSKLPISHADRKEIRKGLYDSFYRDEDSLIELNKLFRKVSLKIAEYGKLYSSRQKINLSVVTRIDDPANVLIQELTLLLKTILMDSFKNVEVDLFALIKEQNEGEGFGYSSSLGISFLKELDLYQDDDYSFNRQLQLTEDYLKLPVTHTKSPLFDLAYLLSDKDENGLYSEDSFTDNCEMISQINLLKNQKVITETNTSSESYNNAQFRYNIQGNTEQNVYATAGFSTIKRPNRTISLHAAYHFANSYYRSMKEAVKQPIEKIVELFELTPSSLQHQILEMIPPKDKIKDMNELIWIDSTYSKIKKMSVKQAEELLYEGVSKDFFATNIAEVAKENLEELKIESTVDSYVFDRVIENREYGLLCAYDWTSDDEGSIKSEVRKMIMGYEKQFSELQGELEQAYQQLVETSPFKKIHLPFSDKKNLRAFIPYLFEEIYGIKYELTMSTTMINYLKRVENQLEKNHEYLAQIVEDLSEVNSLIKEAAKDSLHEADEYIGKNVNEYYQVMNESITERLQQKWGQGYYSEQRFIGNVLQLMKEGKDKYLERLLFICNKEILSQPEFNKTFEDELFERSNVKTNYDNRDVLSRAELFKQLFRRLDENSAVQIEVYNYTHKHRYEEKYFFGDYGSDFMKFALDRELQSRSYKVGCVHEKKTSGIEKLRIMGGFQITDLMYYRNNLKYYQAYLENGFVLHGFPLLQEPDLEGGEVDAYKKV